MEDGESKSDHPVTISAPPAASVTVDPQNPLPEPSFVWRRILTFIVSLALLGLAWHNAIQLHNLGVSGDLLNFAKWCIGLNGFVLLCYFIGPSAAEIVAMIQSARIIRRGMDMATSADNNANGPGNRPRRPGNPGAQRDSGHRTPGDSRNRRDGPERAPTGRYDSDDFAPRGRR